MRPDTTGPWRKVIRQEAKGQPTGRRAKRVELQPIHPGSTWLRRHRWMPGYIDVYFARRRA